MSDAPSRELTPRGGWTPEREALVESLWMKGLSAKQIAGQLGGVTRNAVIGKVGRLGLLGAGPQHAKPGVRKTYVRKRQAPSAPRVPKAIWRPAVDFRRNGAPLPREPVVYSDADLSMARPWLERRFGQCAFPVDGEGADVRSCCAPTSKTYCPAHHAVVYQPNNKPKNAREVRT